MYYNTRYSGSNKEVPDAIAVQIKGTSLLVSRTWENLTEVTFELRLNNELDDNGIGRELQTNGVA